LPIELQQIRQRFTIATILAIMTTFAMLFGGLRYLGAPPPVYLFFGSLAVFYSVVRMWAGTISRLYATGVGALLLPLWLAIFKQLDQRLGGQLPDLMMGLACTLFAGAALGYCTAVLTNGVLSLLEMTASHFYLRRLSVSEETDDE
jgi:hypothetical protein